MLLRSIGRTVRFASEMQNQRTASKRSQAPAKPAVKISKGMAVVKLVVLVAILAGLYFAGHAIADHGRAQEAATNHYLAPVTQTTGAPVSMATWQHGAGGYNYQRITRDIAAMQRDLAAGNTATLDSTDAGNLQVDVQTAGHRAGFAPPADTAAYAASLTDLATAASDLQQANISGAIGALNEASTHAPGWTSSAWHESWTMNG
jgi:hypothetical protein